MAGPGDNQRARKQAQAESEAFKRSITATVRAIAGDGAMEVAFSKDRPALTGNTARLPELPKKPTMADVAISRGTGDSMALRKACHDGRIHMRRRSRRSHVRAVAALLGQPSLSPLEVEPTPSN